MNFTDAVMEMKNGSIMKLGDYLFRIKNGDFENKLAIRHLEVDWIIEGIDFELVNSNKWEIYTPKETLSDKTKHAEYGVIDSFVTQDEMILVDDVKEFINKLKRTIINEDDIFINTVGENSIIIPRFIEIIDRLAGDKLVDK